MQYCKKWDENHNIIHTYVYINIFLYIVLWKNISLYFLHNDINSINVHILDENDIIYM